MLLPCNITKETVCGNKKGFLTKLCESFLYCETGQTYIYTTHRAHLMFYSSNWTLKDMRRNKPSPALGLKVHLNIRSWRSFVQSEKVTPLMSLEMHDNRKTGLQDTFLSLQWCLDKIITIYILMVYTERFVHVSSIAWSIDHIISCLYIK